MLYNPSSERDWETLFKSWTSPSSDTESEKCERAVRMVSQAINAHPVLQAKNISVKAVGSYANNTNVRVDSDVDICVCHRESFFYDNEPGLIIDYESLGHYDAHYRYSEFQSDVEKALTDKFGWLGVTKGNKVFHINETTSRVQADVSVTLEHRRYTSVTGNYIAPVGYEFRTLAGVSVVNWHEQHASNGTAKNNRTNYKYKWIVRILKRLKNEMADQGIQAAKNVPSFLVECLVWNVPDEVFDRSSFKAIIRAVLVHLFNETMAYEKCREWGEVSELKYLFSSRQKWTWQDAHAFIDAAWDYVGYQ